jgi:hypothetical protein
MLLMSIGFALSAFKIRNWIVVPDVHALIKKYGDSSYSEVLKRTGGSMAGSVTDALMQNNSKAGLIEWSWYLLISGLSTVFLFIIVYVITGVESR